MARSRSAGARTWATVLSELAGVPVVVEWESPSWRARWVDGPTRAQLLERATELGRYEIGAPLGVTQMGFSRRVSPLAAAVGWLAHGSQATDSEQQHGLTAEYAVDHWCTDTAYPQQRAGAELLAAALVLVAVSRGSSVAMAALMTAAQPPIEPAELTRPAIDNLPGRVVSYRWPGRGGPPSHLLQPAGAPPATELPMPILTQLTTPTPPTGSMCGRCGDPLPARPGAGGGRPAQYCSDRCRVAAYRARSDRSATLRVS